jgi:hypothetical protein
VSRPRVGVSADAFVAVVRAYADRVHDDVRRLGCTPPEAAEVVETSALNLAERLRTRPGEVPDLVGAWFRDARLYAERVSSGAEVGDAGAGIVRSSDEDAAARRALAELAERDRVALLLRDAYDLPYPSVAVALAVEGAPLVVAKARLRFLRLATGESYDEPSGHDAQLVTTSRLADGTLPADEARDAERHAAKCVTCGPLLTPLREARRLLTGLAILAMPDADRDGLIARATAVAERVLPSAEEVAKAVDGPPPRLVPLTAIAACLGGAVVLGTVIALAGGGGAGRPNAAPTFDIETPTPTPTPSASSATPTPTPALTATPTPTVASPTMTASPTPSQTFRLGDERITISPASGRNGTTVAVHGFGWIPGRTVHMTYEGVLGPTGATATAVAGPDGRFVAHIACQDNSLAPGRHQVVARAGSQSASANFDATP